MKELPISLEIPVGEEDHVRGEPTAPVTIVEYGDYQCPFCKAAESLMEGLERALAGDLRVVFRPFPMSAVHPHALAAAQAAEAAFIQGKFWEMHRLLFANQENLGQESLLTLAASLDLDLERFTFDMARREVADRVQRSLRGGLQSGVRGTPAFFIDGVRYTGYPNLLGMLGEISASHPMLDIALDGSVGNPGVSRARNHR